MNLRNLDELNFRLRIEDLQGITIEMKERLRYECQTNLRFLSNCVLRPPSTRFSSLPELAANGLGHGPMIDSFLVPDPDRLYDEWHPVKERVTLASRGTIKSTLVGAYAVQFQLCDPDIRILIVSGKMPLAKSIMDTARTPFATNDVIRFLFPEMAIDIKDLGGDEFVNPARDLTLNLRDPTLSIATFETVKAGGHFEVIIFDDCTNEINCSNETNAEKCLGFYDDTDPLVEPGGYRHFFGTRWAEDLIDLPEVLRRRGEAKREETGEPSVLYFRMPCWTLREGSSPAEKAAIEERDRKDQLVPEDVVLTWPQKLTAKFLFSMYDTPSKVVRFKKQYLLKYAAEEEIDGFTQDMLIKATRPFNEGMPLPHDRFTVVHWDMGGIWSGVRERKASNYSCGLAVMFECSTKRMFVYDAEMEVFASSSDAALTIADFFRRQLLVTPVEFLEFEDAAGVRMLEGELVRVAREMKIPLKILFRPRSTIPNAKMTRIASLLGAMKRGFVNFSTTIPKRDEIFKQFEKWKPTNKQVKDDAPDCLAQIWSRYKDLIHPGMVSNLDPGETHFAPEPVPISPMEDADPHADERENADIAWLQSMTVPHA